MALIGLGMDLRALSTRCSLFSRFSMYCLGGPRLGGSLANTHSALDFLHRPQGWTPSHLTCHHARQSPVHGHVKFFRCPVLTFLFRHSSHALLIFIRLLPLSDLVLRENRPPTSMCFLNIDRLDMLLQWRGVSL